MSAPGVSARPVRVVIRRVGIAAASPLEARRLADALPRALERAFAPPGDGTAASAPSRLRAAERVAAEVKAIVTARLDRDNVEGPAR